jgi:dihydrofolate reductase
MRELTYFVAMSIDGFIADPEGGAESYPAHCDDVPVWMADTYPETIPTHMRADYTQDLTNRNFDIGIQGLKTYRMALDVGITRPYAHLRQFVVSRSLKETPDPAVELLSGELLPAVRALKAEDSGQNLGIWLQGGAEVAGQLLPEIDRLVIKVYPVVFGSGVPLFSAEFEARNFDLETVKTFGSGALALTYHRR